MADYYVSSSGNDTTGDGTAALPWATTDKVFSEDVLVAGDTVHLAGIIRASTAFSGKSNVTFKQWAGQAQWKQRGSYVITGWTDDTLGAWFATLASSNSVKSVIIDPDTATADANGNLPVHLIAASSLANCRATDNSWWHDTGSNRLYVRIDVSEDPSGFVVEWCEGGVSGLAFNSASGVIVDGGHFEYWCDSSAGNGYGVFFNGSNNICRNCVFRDCGYHSLGVAGSGANGNNLFENITCRGLYPNAGAGVNHLVFYSESNGAIGNRGTGCVLHCHPSLSRATGQPLSATASVGGMYSHTGGGGSPVMDDIQWEDCTCIFKYNTPGSAWDAANTTTPSDPDNWKTFGARFVQCRVLGMRQLATLSHLGHYRCSFHVPNAGEIAAFGRIFSGTGDASTKHWNFTACQIIVDLDHASTTVSIFGANGSGTMSFINTSVIDVGTGSGQRAFVAPFSSSQKFKARGCIFQYNSTNAGLRRLFFNDTFDQTGTPRDMSSNVYVNVAFYSTQAAYDTQAEYAAAIDTTGTYTTTSQFSSLTADDADAGDASLTAAARLTRRQTDPRAFVGYNGLAYSGQYGAWQYGSRTGPRKSLNRRKTGPL